MTNSNENFSVERSEAIAKYAIDYEFSKQSGAWVEAAMRRRYVYNFDWLGRPIIQFPQDIVAMQELVWSTRPDLIIETGVAHGGSLILSASLLAMLDYADAVAEGGVLDPRKSRRRVVGIDIDIRAHNRAAIQAHALAHKVVLIQGSSTDERVVEQVKNFSRGYQRIMVCLDSNHTHDHVLKELRAYGPLTTQGCYCVVFDTFVEDMPANLFSDRPWEPGNNPKTAVREYLKECQLFIPDHALAEKLQITVAPEGFLRRR